MNKGFSKFASFQTVEDRSNKGMHRSARRRPHKWQFSPGEEEICVAYTILRRVLKAARKRNQAPQLTKRIEHFIRSEISRYSELQKEIYSELREWNERYVGTGRTYPKSLLFPRHEKSLQQGRQEFEIALEWFKRWERQIKSPRKPRNTRVKRYTTPSSV